MTDPDDKLVQKAIAGKSGAFNKLVTKYQQRILFLAYDIVGDYEAAQDIAQDAFIRAYNKLSDFQGNSRFSTWLYRITVNLAIDYHRKNKKRSDYSIDAATKEIELTSEMSALNSTSNFSENLERDELKRQLEQALTYVSPQQRTAITLRYFHEKSTREIAEIMGCAENTVRIHIFRGLKHLRKSLNKNEFTDK